MTKMPNSRDPQGMPARTGRSLPIALLRARETVMERFRPMLAAHGVTEQQWRVLRVLGEEPKLEAGAVASRACIRPPSLSRIIKALEASGHITVSRDASDGRRTLLALGARGRRLLDQAAPESAAIHASIERAFGAAESKRLLDLLEDLQQRLAAT